jgi:hypothetical protein
MNGMVYRYPDIAPDRCLWRVGGRGDDLSQLGDVSREGNCHGLDLVVGDVGVEYRTRLM